MPRQIKGPDGILHVFPDDATDQEISTALEAQPTPPAHARTWMDTATDWLPAAGGAVGGIVGGIGGTVAGMGVGGVPGAVGGAALGGAVGEAAKELLNRARGAPAPSTPREALTTIGEAAAWQGGAELAGGAVGRGMASVAPRVMQSAVKPGIAALKGIFKGEAVPRVVQTLLDEGINVTPKGLAKLQTLLSSTQQDIKASLDAAEAAGHTVSPYRVASRLNDTAKTFANQVNPAADLEAVSKVGQEFLETHGGSDLAPTAAQSLKQGTYAQVKKKYGQLSSAAVEAEKALARGLKEELERIAPGIEGLNATQGARAEALQAVGKRVAMTRNRDLGGLADLAISHPLTFLTVLADRSPAVKSMLARGLYQSAGAVTKVAPQVIRSAVQAVASQQEEQP